MNRQKTITFPPRIIVQGGSIDCFGNVRRPELLAALYDKDLDKVGFQRRSRLISTWEAEAIARARTIRELWMWGAGLSRAALNRLVLIPGLEQLNVLSLRGEGRLKNFRSAVSLDTFRCSFDLRTADIVELSRLPKLRTLSAQCATLGLKAMNLLAEKEGLEDVDFEGVVFSDEMAASIAQSKSIHHLALPSTNLTLAGLRAVSDMQRLSYLDIWGNGFKAEHLECLAGHPSLEMLEFGGFITKVVDRPKARDIIPWLEKIPKLKWLRFDNVTTTADEQQYLAKRYDFHLLMDEED